MYPQTSPKSIHGEFGSADASALTENTSRFTLYGRAKAAAMSLDASDYLVVTDITISTITALTISVFDGADATPDAGEKIVRLTLAANNAPVHITLKSPFVCKVGTYPKVKTSGIGQIDVTIHGFVEKE